MSFGGTGFSFGGANATNNNNAPKPFSFGGSPSAGNNQAGQASTGATPAPVSAAGFSFGGGFKLAASAAPASNATTTTPAGQPPTNLFGNATKPPASGAGLFGQKPPATGGFSFGGTSTTSTPAPTTTGGFSFRNAAAKPAEQPKPASGGFSGFNLGVGADAKKPATGGFNLAGSANKDAPNPFAPKSSEAPASTAAAPAPAPSTGGFSFGNKPAEPAAAKPATDLFSGFGAKPAESNTATAKTTPAPAAAAPVAAPSLLRGKSMDEIVNKWSSELDSAVKEFSKQAGEVAAWDRVLLKGGDEISKLLSTLSAAEDCQTGIEQTLNYVETQQTELTTLLDGYQSQIGDLVETTSSYGRDVGAADVEREKAYSLAESLNAQLDDISRNLSSMIGEVNALSCTNSSTTAEPDMNALRTDQDPVTQIASILNAHLASLKWIDDSSANLREKIQGIRRGQVA